MNKAVMMGRLTADPQTRYGQQSGTAISTFSLAVNRRIRRDGEPEADFFNCVAFGKFGEFVERYLRKGTKILIECRVENNNWTDQQGTKHYGTRLTCESIEFAESKSSGGGSGNQGGGYGPADPDGFVHVPDNMPDDDLPFN